MSARHTICLMACFAALALGARPAAAQNLYYDSGTGFLIADRTIYSPSYFMAGGGTVYNSNTTRRWVSNNDYNTFYTDYGYIQIGPDTSDTWTQFNSTLNFYFNQQLYVNGTQVVTNNGGTWGIGITGNAASTPYASNVDTVDSVHAASFSRKDADFTWVRPYYRWNGSNWGSESPAALTETQMGGAGFRVDFMTPGYTADGNYANVITFSGYNKYYIYQLAASYGATSLYYRSGYDGTWYAWRGVLYSGSPTTKTTCSGGWTTCTPPTCPYGGGSITTSCTGNHCYRLCMW